LKSDTVGVGNRATSVRRFRPPPFSRSVYPAPVASLAVGVGSSGPGEDEHAFPFVGGAGIAGADTDPFRIEPERGQVAEYNSECGHNRLA
jgi:hypothetical protein